MGSLVTRFPNGLTNVAASADMASLPFPDPTRYNFWYDDFHGYTAAEWTVTESAAGATQAVADAEGGQLVLTNTATDAHANYLEWAAGETFLLQSGKKAWMKARWKANDAAADITNADWFIGLHVTSTTPLAAAQRAIFRCADTSAAVVFEMDDGTIESSAQMLETLVGDTFITTAMYYDGASTIDLFLNDALVFRQALVTNLPGASNPLAVGFGVLNGEAVAKVLTVDYLMVATER